MNTVILMGRICRDLEVKHTASDKSVLNFGIALDSGWGDNKKTVFINCTAWENTANFISNYFQKGSLIALTGELDTNSYTDKNGNNRTDVFVKVSKAEFTGEKAKTDAKPSGQAQANNTASADEVDDDDLPF